MTKKDYVLIAQCFQLERERVNKGAPYPTSISRDTVDDLAHTIASRLAVDNPRFDKERFLKACKGEK